VVFPK